MMKLNLVKYNTVGVMLSQMNEVFGRGMIDAEFGCTGIIRAVELVRGEEPKEVFVGPTGFSSLKKNRKKDRGCTI